MTRQNATILAGFLLSLMIVLGGASLAKGGFYIGKHEGDTLHLLQMTLRMAAGDWPHLDFVTPIGVLAFAPIALFLKLGSGVGHAILYAQILVAIVAFPAIWWVAASRWRGGWAYLFGAIILVLILALVHGETDRSVSISMHYNRWAWAGAFLAISTAVMPPLGRKRPAVDGIVIGLALAALALIKITYFVAFAPPVAVALIARRSGRTMLWTLLSGLSVAAMMTALAGPDFWLAYLRDLISVAGSEVRPRPGLPFAAVLGAPAYMGGSIVVLTGVILLRQAGRDLEGLLLLLLVPGFFYVTYQNFANDPQWLGLVGMMLIVLRPKRAARNALGWDLQRALVLAGVVALSFATPSFLNLAYSPFRHLTVDVEEYAPLLPGSGLNEDLQTAAVRAKRVDAKVAMDGPGTLFAGATDPELRDDPTIFRGEELPVCSVELGIVAWFAAMSADLKASGLSDGKTVFAADLLSSFWLFGAFEPLPGGAPWYYGGLPGFDNADYLIVPLCPLSQKARAQILEAVDAAGTELTEIRRTELYILYAR